MHKRTKALAISPEVKKRVWERDAKCCVWCGSFNAAPEAHFIPRSLSGLGIEENVLTLCRKCHNDFDRTPKREEMRNYFRKYLQSMYPDWDEKNLIYRKDMEL